MRVFIPVFAVLALVGCTTTTTTQNSLATNPPETEVAAAPAAESASRPLPRYCEDRRGAEILVTAILVPCVMKSHPLTQLTMGNQKEDVANQRPIGMFERRFDAAMILRDASGKDQTFTGSMIGAASGAGTVYMTSEDGTMTCTAESNLRQGVGNGTCSNGQTLAFRFAPQQVRTNGHIIAQQVGGSGLVVVGWGSDASVSLLRGKLQPAG